MIPSLLFTEVRGLIPSNLASTCFVFYNRQKLKSTFIPILKKKEKLINKNWTFSMFVNYEDKHNFKNIQ